MKLVVILLGIVIVIGTIVLFQMDASSDAAPTEAGETMNHDGMSAEEMEAMGHSDAVEASESDGMNVTDGTSAATSEETAETNTVSFTVDSFAFGYSMNEIRVKEGDTVTVNLTNSGGMHDWVVDEFNAATDVIPAGGATSVTFVADKAGTYEYYCSVGNHRERGMVGTLIVE